MSQRRQYRRPPIEEALCEFRFEAGRAWDATTVVDRVRGVLGDEYGGVPRQQREVEVGIGVEPGRAPAVKVVEGAETVQLITEDGTRLLGVGRDALRVHMLRPYQKASEEEVTGWNEFKARISDALNAYWGVTEPEGVRRVGVRYINRIVVPGRRVRVDEYLPYALADIGGLPETVTNFVSRVEYSYADGVRLILTQGTGTASSDDHQALLLDIDVIREGIHGISGSEALAVAEDLRNRERDAFEAAITDKARSLFDAD